MELFYPKQTPENKLFLAFDLERFKVVKSVKDGVNLLKMIKDTIVLYNLIIYDL